MEDIGESPDTQFYGKLASKAGNGELGDWIRTEMGTREMSYASMYTSKLKTTPYRADVMEIYREMRSNGVVPDKVRQYSSR